MLSVENLRVSYGKTAALQGVSLEVNQGEIVGVIGPNGAGKSTLLLAVAGGLAIGGGEIRLEGRSLVGDRPDRIARAGISLVPEGRHIFSKLTVEENLQLGSTPRRDRADAADDLEYVLDLFPALRSFLPQMAGRLSGGEQQQLAIARALLARPRLLMLDEPSLGLAPIIVSRVFETLEKLRADGVTILLVEQVAGRTIAVADRTYVLRTGRIALSGTREELRASGGLQAAFMGFHHAEARQA